MTNIVKLVLVGICFLLLIRLISKIIDFFIERSQNRFLSKIIKSDPIMKKLIKNAEQKMKKKVKFATHPLSILYSDIMCAWGIEPRTKKILVPLDQNRVIRPKDKDRQIHSFAHELAHLIRKDFKNKKKSCGHRLMDCMFCELKTDSLAVELLKEVGIEIGKQIFKDQKQQFWFARIKSVVDIQCQECHQIVKQEKCPRLKEILECLGKIASDANLELISDSVS